VIFDCGIAGRLEGVFVSSILDHIALWFYFFFMLLVYAGGI